MNDKHICLCCGRERPEHKMRELFLGGRGSKWMCWHCEARSTEDYVGRHMDIISTPRYQRAKAR